MILKPVSFYAASESESEFYSRNGTVPYIASKDQPLAVGCQIDKDYAATASQVEHYNRAFALYDKELTATEVADISTKMALL